jgi:ABC-type dipeptide/oligopeptide/nickel transport system permease subunit
MKGMKIMMLICNWFIAFPQKVIILILVVIVEELHLEEFMQGMNFKTLVIACTSCTCCEMY